MRILKPVNRRYSRLSQPGRTAEPISVQSAVPNWFRCRTSHELNSVTLIHLRWSTVSETGLKHLTIKLQFSSLNKFLFILFPIKRVVLRKITCGSLLLCTTFFRFFYKNVKFLGWGWMFLNTLKIAASNVLKMFISISCYFITSTFVIFHSQKTNRKHTYALSISRYTGWPERNHL